MKFPIHEQKRAEKFLVATCHESNEEGVDI